MLLVKGSSYERNGCKRPLYYAEQNGKSVEGLFIYSRQKGTDAKDAMLYVMRRGLFITRSRTGNLLKRYAIS
jgi:hypothetical protein